MLIILLQGRNLIYHKKVIKFLCNFMISVSVCIGVNYLFDVLLLKYTLKTHFKYTILDISHNLKPYLYYINVTIYQSSLLLYGRIVIVDVCQCVNVSAFKYD